MLYKINNLANYFESNTTIHSLIYKGSNYEQRKIHIPKNYSSNSTSIFSLMA